MNKVSILIIALCACQGDPLEDAGDIAGWANSASSLAVYTHGYEPIAIADGEITLADPSCPVVVDHSTKVTITGDGCIDSKGDEFFGTATVVRTATGLELTLDGYGHGRDGGAVSLVTGTFAVTSSGQNVHTFNVDLISRGGIDTDIVYTGRVEGTYDEPTLWNGSGTIRRNDMTINSGRVEATTVDQLRDNDICPGQNVSGVTTLASEEHTVEITYDGASDCDDDYSARWSRNGQDQGVVTGVTCSTSGRGGSWLGLALVVGLAFVLRRKPRAK
ncbi:MAG: hypothetical protein MJE77_13605 [Proteobacteria bacterium]|nr:hypothetical protein [Pseudomonadota bacterium]